MARYNRRSPWLRTRSSMRKDERWLNKVRTANTIDMYPKATLDRKNVSWVK